MSLIKTIEDMLATGLGVSTGTANDIPGYSSGGQRLRDIIRANPKKYCYVMIRGEHGTDYKVFYLKLNKRIKLCPVGNGFRLTCSIGDLEYLHTKVVDTRKAALGLIKKCGV